MAGEFGDRISASVEVQAEGEESTGGGALRMYPRWSATTLAIGLREVQFAPHSRYWSSTTCRTGTGSFVGLALWDAYNRVPFSSKWCHGQAGGVLREPDGL